MWANLITLNTTYVEIPAQIPTKIPGWDYLVKCAVLHRTSGNRFAGWETDIF